VYLLTLLTCVGCHDGGVKALLTYLLYLLTYLLTLLTTYLLTCLPMLRCPGSGLAGFSLLGPTVRFLPPFDSRRDGSHAIVHARNVASSELAHDAQLAPGAGDVVGGDAPR